MCNFDETTFMVPVCPKDNILVTLDSKFRDTTSGGLLIDTGFRPGVHATVTGRVVSVPKAISSHFQRSLVAAEVEPGDDLAFNYRVVYNQEITDNGREVFHEEPIANPYITKWANMKGEYLVRINKGNGKFDCAHHTVVDNKPVFIDRIQDCNVTQANDWINARRPDTNNFIRYKNCLWTGEEEYWKVDYLSAYIARRRNRFIMIGGMVLLEHPGGKIDRGDVDTSLELWGDARRETKKELRTRLIAIGTPVQGQPKLSVKEGDTVVVNGHTAQEYNFWGNDYLLVRQDQILGKA